MIDLHPPAHSRSATAPAASQAGTPPKCAASEGRLPASHGLSLSCRSWAPTVRSASAALLQHRLAGLLLHEPGLFQRVDLGQGRTLAVLLLHRLRRQIAQSARRPETDHVR